MREKNEIIENLLGKGKAFDEYFSGYKKERYPTLGAFGDEAFRRQEINDCLRMSPFKDLFEGLSDEIVYDIYLRYEAEKTQTKKWILNSEVRAKTFELLGKHHPCSVKEIEEKMGRRDRNIYKALDQFNKKKLVNKKVDPEDGRVNLCHLTEVGDYFYFLAMKENWFVDLAELHRSIENTILKINFFGTHHEEKTGGIISYEGPVPDFFDFPNINNIIKEIKMVGFKFISNLNLEMQLPELTGEKNLLKINSTNEDELAVIFACFNYLEKLRRTWDYPRIQKIKIIKTENFFDSRMPNIKGEDGFMSGTETQDYIAKIMKKFKEKLSNHKKR